MTQTARDLIGAHWRHANARDWAAFAQLLHPDLYYEVPQTREYSEGSAAYLEMFVTWPQPWQATVLTLIAEDHQALSIVAFDSGTIVETGISVFRIQDNRIIRVTDYWPAPYEPPPRLTSLLKRMP